MCFVVRDHNGQTALSGLLFGAGVRLITREVRMSDPARVQGLAPRPPAARAAHEGLLHRLKLLIVRLLMKVLKLAAARITRQLAQ
jgi:hypothetical protein